MKLAIDVRGAPAVADLLRSFSDRRMGSALAAGINAAAFSVRDAWRHRLEAGVDRPTALTRNAARLARADVGRLVAEVSLRDTVGGAAGSGTPPQAYLGPLERGGRRGTKKFESALVSRGAMPPGQFVVPARYARLDSYGNISRGQIVQVLNQLGANLSPGYQQVISKAAARRERAVGRVGAGRRYVSVPVPVRGLKAGIYERKGRALLPVFWFTGHATYRPTLHLVAEGVRIAQDVLPRTIGDAINQRLASLQRRSGAGR